MKWMALGATAALLMTTAPLWAQDDDFEDEDVELSEDVEDVELEDEPADEAEEGSDEGEAAGEGDAAADDGGENSPVELPGETYRFVGARYRGIIVPKFFLNFFADGGATTYVHSFGAEYASRKDGFEMNFGAWLGLYHMDPVAMKGKSDPVQAWEIVESKINVFYLTADLLWSHEFSPELSLLYGAGFGMGIVFGDLFRNQTYPPNGDANSDPNGWEKCVGVGNPNPSFCDNDNDHYGDYTEPSWVNGGSKPNVFPWIAAQTGLRYKVSRQFVSRLELGFGMSGFFFGIGADYGL